MANSMTPLAGWVMIVVSALVIYAAFPGRFNVVFLPRFLGAFGIPFAILYLGAQYALAAYLRRRRGLLLVTVLFILGAALGALGRAVDIHGFFAEHDISYFEYVLCAGSCVSGLGFGIALVRGWVYEED